MKFYAYLWLRHDGTPCYAGKGCANRAFMPCNHRINCPRSGNRIDRSRIILEYFESEADAFAAEIFLISFYGRIDLRTGCLQNLTNGGEGVSGRKMTAENRTKLREANLGKKASPKTIERLRESHLGNKTSAELCRVLGAKAKGVPLSEEHKKKLSDYAKCRSLEHRAKLSAAHLGRKRGPMSQEHRLKLSIAHKGKKYKSYPRAKHSPETIQKLRDAARRRRAK